MFDLIYKKCVLLNIGGIYMRIQPVTTRTQTTKQTLKKQGTTFNGSWNAEKLNILGRSRAEMRELGRYFWCSSERELEEVSTIRNFLGIKKTRASKEAFAKLQAAANEAFDEMKEILKSYNKLNEKNPRTAQEEAERSRLLAAQNSFPDRETAKKLFYDGYDYSGSSDVFSDNLSKTWNNIY